MRNNNVDTPKNFTDTIKKLFTYFLDYKYKLILIFVFNIFGTLAFIEGPNILRLATNKLFDAKQYSTPIDFDYILKIILILLAMYIIGFILSALQGAILGEVSQSIAYTLRKNISEKLNKLPLKYYDKHPFGDILSRITNDIDTVSLGLTQNLSEAFSAILKLIGVIIIMFTISWQLTLIALLVIPLSMFAGKTIVSNTQKFFKDQQNNLGKVNSNIQEQFSGHNIIKSFNHEEKSINEFKILNTELYNASFKAQFLSNIIFPVMFFITNLSYVAVAMSGAILTIMKIIKFGDIFAFIQYVRMMGQPISQLASIINSLQLTVAASERIFELLDEEEEKQNNIKEYNLENVKGNVEFRNINFSYTPEKEIIHNFSSKIKAGSKIAIVGPTGAGKTTIIKLITRFYDLNSGEILIDDMDISTIEKHQLRNLFAIVLQDTWLYNGTIMENIRYGNLNATDEEVIQAAKLANAHKFIKKLPNGYNMQLNEDANNISQGQKQLLTIARAILSDPKILILDESTSSVDTRTELLLQEAIDTVMEGRTSFVIAHRLSTIKNADIILVMKDGNIIEQGNHEELIKQNGFYKQLYESQFEN